MKLEIIFSQTMVKHIEHITEKGKTKVQFEDRKLDKLVSICEYINSYLASKKGRIINIENNGSELLAYLEIDE